MPFKQFDRRLLKLKPLSERVHDLYHETDMLSLDGPIPAFDHPTLDVLADRIRKAKERGSTVMMMMGAHVIRAGTAPFLI